MISWLSLSSITRFSNEAVEDSARHPPLSHCSATTLYYCNIHTCLSQVAHIEDRFILLAGSIQTHSTCIEAWSI